MDLNTSKLYCFNTVFTSKQNDVHNNRYYHAHLFIKSVITTEHAVWMIRSIPAIGPADFPHSGEDIAVISMRFGAYMYLKQTTILI